MSTSGNIGRWAVMGLAGLLLGAAPAAKPAHDHHGTDDEKYPDTLPNFRDAKPRPDRPRLLVRPPTDPQQYQAAVDRLRAAPRDELFAFASFEGTVPEENLGEGSRVGNAQLRLASLQVPLAPEDVFDRYRVWLSGRGVAVITGNPAPNTAYLSYRDPSDGFMRSITLIGQGQTTLVVAAVGDPKKMMEPSPMPTAPADWPLPPVLGKPLDMETVEGDRKQRSRFATVGCQDATDIIGYFEVHLPELGWSTDPATRSMTPAMSRAQFKRAETYCDVTVNHGRVQNRSACTVNVVCISQR